MKNETLALVIDGDLIAYKALSAATKDIQWSDENQEVWTTYTDHDDAWNIFTSKIKQIIRKRKSWETAKIVLAFTDKVNWRKDILPSYKSNRALTRKPAGYNQFVERIMKDDRWVSFVRDNLEADDCMGILATKPQLLGVDKAILVSGDKDFKTIPCDFYWLTKDKILTISEEEAAKAHMYQTLIGDATDGYYGIAGIGDSTAKDFLDNPYYYVQETKTIRSGKRKGEEVTQWVKKPKDESKTLWECLLTLGFKAGMMEEEILKQAQVARICRHEDYDFETKSVIYWQPK